MIAFHFPPMQGSSGIQRTLRFARDLPRFGWQPIVLSVHPRAYERTATDQIDEIPASVPVVRAQAWDAARHFSVGGHYPGWLAQPDRWMSWRFGAIPAGLAAIRKYAPAALWSTYPIATAHQIGASLHRRSALPWIADFRDPMAQDGYPEDPRTWRSFEAIERRSMSLARFCTFTTPGSVRAYQDRYPGAAERIVLLENGYDEESFGDIPAGPPLEPGRLTLLHSGVVYPSERDPRALFGALGLLRTRNHPVFARLKLRFRAPVHDDLLHTLARQHDVTAAIEVLSPIGYRDALSEMVRADGLIILQAANCNAQVPAKLYEYLRARRPVLALTDPAGDTACVARGAGITAIAPLDDPGAIAALLERFVEAPAAGTLATEQGIASASRLGRAGELAVLLDRASSGYD